MMKRLQILRLRRRQALRVAGLLVLSAGITLCIPGDLLAAPASLGSPPQASGAERKLIAITATGSKRFSSPDIAASSGLQLGFIAVDEDFKKAARRLAETGAFTDVAYTFSYSSEGTKLELQVTDAAKFFPAHFEDFVWFSDAELQKRLHERLPLFHGDLPVSGSLPDLVSDVLQAMLVENNIPGLVRYLRPSDRGGPTSLFIYSVTGVLIRVHNIEFSGAGADEVPLLEAAAKKLPDHEYTRTGLASFAQRELLPVYHTHGFLKAAFGTPTPKVVNLAPGDPSLENHPDVPNEAFVDVTFPVTPGPQYKISALEWTGNHRVPCRQASGLGARSAGAGSKYRATHQPTFWKSRNSTDLADILPPRSEPRPLLTTPPTRWCSTWK